MTPLNSIVFVVHGDSSTRHQLQALLSAHNLHHLAFRTATEYLACERREQAACVILDVTLPDISGFELQRQIAGSLAAVLFVTRDPDIASSVRAIKAGAVDFLAVPFSERDVLDAVHAAIARHMAKSEERARTLELEARFSRLTHRERQVLALVVSGLLNKQVARELGISETTVQIHRGRGMLKMKAGSFAELVRFAELLRIPLAKSDRASREALQTSPVSIALAQGCETRHGTSHFAAVIEMPPPDVRT